MDFGKSDERVRAEAALAAAHAADMEAIRARYIREIGRVARELDGVITVVRRECRCELARILGEFEKARALSVARFEVARGLLVRSGCIETVVGKA